MRCKGCRVHILVATGSKSASQKDTTFIVMKIAASHVMDCPGAGGDWRWVTPYSGHEEKAAESSQPWK